MKLRNLFILGIFLASHLTWANKFSKAKDWNLDLSSLNQKESCQKLEELVLTKTSKNSMNTDSFMVYQQNSAGVGKILIEKYNSPFTESSVHPLWSASKAITTAMVGRAVQLGVLRLDEKIYEVAPKFFNAQMRKENQERFFSYRPDKRSLSPNEKYFQDISIKNLIEMTTGIDWFEHEDHGVKNASSLLMLYGPGARNTSHFAFSLPMAFPPGRAWNYSSGNTVILSGLLNEIYGQRGKSFPDELLFGPLEMNSAYIEKDASGVPVGSSFAYMTPREMLKFGKLYLNKGKLNGRQYLPAGWTDYVQKLIPEYSNNETDTEYVKKEQMIYGTSFAINKAVVSSENPEKNIPQPFPQAPGNMYFAAGHFGQLIIILPTQNAIIVRTGYDKSYWSRVGDLTALTMQCFNL